MDKKKKILYGAGSMGKRAFDYFTKDDPDAVYCFADTFKGGTKHCGKPVVSFEDFVKIYNDYDVIICIFDLFELLHDFDRVGIRSFTVWDDNDALSVKEVKERNAKYHEYLRKLDLQDSRKKILYGAGNYGRKAFYFYGEDHVFAFADMNKSCDEYYGKPVVHPSELVNYDNKYDIIICVKDNYDILMYLKNMNIKNFRIYVELEDVRSENPALNYTLKDTIYDPNILNLIKQLDFIENPDLINEYYNGVFNESRKLAKIKQDKEKIVPRFINENNFYGHLDCMLDYAGKELQYYEAPSIHHAYKVIDYPIKLEWNNLIEPGVLSKPSIHKCSKDCLCFVVGPYFHYTKSFYSEEKIINCKKKHGKNLTVFTTHSLPTTKLNYDSHSFVSYVLEEAKKFDSLSVCVFFNDYNSDTVKIFRANGAKIVTAGYPADPSFIKRLKTIILLSDAVLTNSYGSYINHALSVNRPVKLFAQDVQMRGLIENNDYLNKVNTSTFLNIRKVLETDNYQITQEQLDAYEPSTGFTQTKTKEEMCAIFDLSKRIIQNCDYKRSKYIDSLRQTYRELQYAISPEEKLQFRLMQEALPDDYDEYLKNLKK